MVLYSRPEARADVVVAPLRGTVRTATMFAKLLSVAMSKRYCTGPASSPATTPLTTVRSGVTVSMVVPFWG